MGHPPSSALCCGHYRRTQSWSSQEEAHTAAGYPPSEISGDTDNNSLPKCSHNFSNTGQFNMMSSQIPSLWVGLGRKHNSLNKWRTCLLYRKLCAEALFSTWCRMRCSVVNVSRLTCLSILFIVMSSSSSSGTRKDFVYQFSNSGTHMSNFFFSELFQGTSNASYESSELCKRRSKYKVFWELTREQAHPALIHKVLTVVNLCLDVTQNPISLSVQGL